MRFMSFASSCLIVLTLTGCALPFRSSNLIRNCPDRSEWCPEIQSTARSAWLYAQLSENAYHDSGTFVLPESVRRDTLVSLDGSGFAAAVYSILSASGREQVVIAYRGTQFTSWKDWSRGNIGMLQNRQALAFYDSVRARVGDSVPIAVTGHSLGGAMATSVSLRRAGVPTYVFNTSSHFTRGTIEDSPRVSVASYGEILKGVRFVLRNTDQVHTVIPCVEGNVVERHSQRALATCLTQIAALTDDAAARSLARNGLFSRPRP